MTKTGKFLCFSNNKRERLVAVSCLGYLRFLYSSRKLPQNQVLNRAELVYLSDSLRHSYRNVFRDTINIGSIQPSFKSDITSVVQILLYFILQKVFCDTYSSAFS